MEEEESAPCRGVCPSGSAGEDEEMGMLESDAEIPTGQSSPPPLRLVVGRRE